MDINILNNSAFDLIMLSEIEVNAIVFAHIVEIDYIVNKENLTLDDIVLFLNSNKEN